MIGYGVDMSLFHFFYWGNVAVNVLREYCYECTEVVQLCLISEKRYCTGIRLKQSWLLSFFVFCRFNIRVNTILPGFIETPMTQVVPEKVMNMILYVTPLQRLGKPEGRDFVDFAVLALYHTGMGWYRGLLGCTVGWVFFFHDYIKLSATNYLKKNWCAYHLLQR